MIKQFIVLMPLALSSCVSSNLDVESEQFLFLESSDPRAATIENRDYRLTVKVKTINASSMWFQIEVFNKHATQNIILRPSQIQMIGDAWEHRPSLLSQNIQLESITDQENSLHLQNGVVLAMDLLLLAANLASILDNQPSTGLHLQNYDLGYTYRDAELDRLQLQRQYVTDSYLTTTSIFPQSITQGEIECRGQFSRGDFALVIPIRDEIHYLRYRINED